MSVSRLYREAWENYWRGTSDTPGEAIWDIEPSLAVALHLERLRPYADPALPVVDLGCGNGTQTRYLAEHFPRAYGVDLAQAAVERARRADPGGTVAFRQLDVTDQAGVRALHGSLGDCNVYLRSVIRQSDPQDRQPVADAVATLAGQLGRAFVVELTETSGAVLGEMTRDPEGMPPKLRRVVAHGLRPAEADNSEVPGLLGAAGLKVFEQGFVTLPQTEYRADGSRIELPAQWFVVGRG